MSRPDNYEMTKLEVGEEYRVIDGSGYLPLYHPNGTSNPTPIAWVRADFVNSISRTLDIAANERKL